MSSGMTLLLGALGVFFLGLMDYATGYELGFFVFYFLPISLVSWAGGVRHGCMIATLSASVWFASDYFGLHEYSTRWYQLWNTGIRFFSFLVIGFGVARIRELLLKERALISELRDALEQVKTLEGLLPICSGCKKIRNDEGYWQQIEEYLHSHTDVQFTHGLCFDCAGKYLREAGLDEAFLE